MLKHNVVKWAASIVKRLNIWRVAGIISILSALAFTVLFLSFAYNIGFVEYSRSVHPSGGLVAFLWIAAAVISAGLITYTAVCFFYFLYKSLPLFVLPIGLLLKGKSYTQYIKRKNCIGLLLTSTLLVIEYFLALNFAAMWLATNYLAHF